MKVTFTIQGRPKGKERPRMNRGTGAVYTPRGTNTYEQAVAWKYRETAKGGSFGEKPVKVQITAYFKIPKSFSLYKKEQAARGEITPTVKPDTDNIIKIILDSLNGVAYRDDKQVIEVRCQKQYGTEEQVTVTIEEEKDHE